MTVAVKTRYKKWHCKQVAMHGVHSDRCYLKDMVFYYIGGYITNNQVIITRSGEFWALISPCAIGFCCAILAKLLFMAIKTKALEPVLCIILVFAGLALMKPAPIIPYKMENNSGVEQYLRLNSLTPKTWMIVSQNEGYAIVFLRGSHMYVADLLKDYNPKAKYLAKRNKPDDILPTDVFVYYQKKVFRTSFENLQSRYDMQEKEMPKLKEWIDQYKAAHPSVKSADKIYWEIFYDGPDLMVFHIHQPEKQSKTAKKLWGVDIVNYN
jgi:hypothetical protein